MLILIWILRLICFASAKTIFFLSFFVFYVLETGQVQALQWTRYMRYVCILDFPFVWVILSFSWRNNRTHKIRCECPVDAPNFYKDVRKPQFYWFYPVQPELFFFCFWIKFSRSVLLTLSIQNIWAQTSIDSFSLINYINSIKNYVKLWININ